MNNLTTKKTHNSFLAEKVDLRKNIVQDGFRVLDCYSYEGKLWDYVIKETGYKLKIFAIEIENVERDDFYFKADNTKFLQNLDLNKFDVIDLDAFGSPFELLEIIFYKNWKGKIVFTYIVNTTRMQGGVPKKLLSQIGYSRKMVDKVPTLFSKNPKQKFFRYLYNKGIKEVVYYENIKQLYGYFEIK